MLNSPEQVFLEYYHSNSGIVVVEIVSSVRSLMVLFLGLAGEVHRYNGLQN